MAFQPYSGDLRRPSAAVAAPSYFTAAALRAGYAVAPPPPLAAHRDALHRELHGERVREDYFAREIARSRSLLDQRLRHQPAPIYPPRTEFVPAPVPPQHVERLPYFLEAGVERQLGYTRTPAALRPQAVIRKPPPLVKRAAVARAEGTLPQKLSGIKRKAATTEAVNDPPQQDKKWSCSLCQVFTTSEQDLKSHLQGQKHKAIQESRSSQSKVADKSLPADGLKGTLPQKLSGIKRKAATTEAVNDPPQQDKKWSCSLCQVFTTSERDLKRHLQGQKHKAIQESRSLQLEVADKSLPADGLKEADEQLSTNIDEESFFCGVCKLKCNSLIMLKSHLQGQKHKATQEYRSSLSKVADKSLPADGLKEVDKQLSTNIEKESFLCGVCKLKCNSLTMLKSHLSGKKHKEGLRSSQSEVQSFDCDDCKLKCNSLSNLKLHLNGKKHKEQLEELNKVQNDKPVTAEQSGKDSSPASVEGSGK